MRDNETFEAFTAADGGKYRLRYDFNKLCEMEQVGLDLLSGNIDARKLQSPLFVRQLFFDGCTDEQGQPLPDLTAAGHLVQEMGLPVAVQRIAAALAAAAFPDSANPQTARPGA